MVEYYKDRCPSCNSLVTVSYSGLPQEFATLVMVEFFCIDHGKWLRPKEEVRSTKEENLAEREAEREAELCSSPNS